MTTNNPTTPQQPAPGGPETEIESARGFARRMCQYLEGDAELVYGIATQELSERDAQNAAQARAAALGMIHSLIADRVKRNTIMAEEAADFIKASHYRAAALALAMLRDDIRALGAAAQEPASDPQPAWKVDGVLCAKCSHSGWSHDTMTGDCMQCGCRAFKESASDPQPAASDERSVGT